MSDHHSFLSHKLYFLSIILIIISKHLLDLLFEVGGGGGGGEMTYKWLLILDAIHSIYLVSYFITTVNCVSGLLTTALQHPARDHWVCQEISAS